MQIQVIEKTGAAIQNAINQAAAAGGGKVVLEPGIYPSGTLYLKSNIELHLQAGAVVLGHPKPEMYDDFRHPGFDTVTPEFSRKCLIACADCENIAITGPGTINGQGPEFYDRNIAPGEVFFHKPPHPRPRIIQFYNCRNVVIEDITLLDSPGWTAWLIACEDVRINRIRVIGCQQMINNDGIDIDSCRNVTVSDSFFRTGDDCLILRAIRRSPDTASVCEHVMVNNCILNSWCNGIRLGCPSDDTIRHCMFSNIVFSGRDDSIRGTAICSQNIYRALRKNCSGYLHLHDIVCENFDMSRGRTPIEIKVEEGITLRGIQRLTFKNFRVQAKNPITLHSCSQSVLQDISLENFHGTIESDIPIQIKYVRNLRLSDFQLTAETGESAPYEYDSQRVSGSWEAAF